MKIISPYSTRQKAIWWFNCRYSIQKIGDAEKKQWLALLLCFACQRLERGSTDPKTDKDDVANEPETLMQKPNNWTKKNSDIYW